MFMNKKIIFSLLVVLGICAQDIPATPLKPQAKRAKSAFWRGGSSESSPESKGTSLSNSVSSSPVAPSKPGLLGSPLQRKLANLLESNEQNSENESGNGDSGTTRKKLRFDTFADEHINACFKKNLMKNQKEKAVAQAQKIIAEAKAHELVGHYQAFAQHAFDDVLEASNSENYDSIVRMPLLQALVAAARKYQMSTDFLPLPLFPFAHFQEPDEECGGYHQEAASNPVTRVLTNPETGVYGGFFEMTGQKSKHRKKFSTFVPQIFSMEDVVERVKYAYAHQFAQGQKRRLGKDATGMVWEMYQAKDFTLDSAFPLVAYSDLTDKSAELSLEVNGELQKYTQQQLLGHAQQVAFESGYRRYGVVYEDTKTVDIAPSLTGLAGARGLYVKPPASDL